MVLPQIRLLPDCRAVSGLALSFVRGISVVVDNDYRSRLTIAFVLAVGLHGIAFWCFPAQRRVLPETGILSEPVTIAKRKIVRKPIALVKPQPRLASKAVAPLRKRHGGKASPHIHIAQLAPRAKPRPVSLAKNIGRGVAGAGVGGAIGVGVGSGGEGGVGSGVEGNGPGDAATAPCGFVEFKPLRQETTGGKHYVWVQILVHLRDGEIIADDLQWPFVYAGDVDNPWSARNAGNPDFQTVMQLPPPDFNLEAEQAPATVLAVRQTGPDGFTLLKPCPDQP
jgi:hypothetical protein